MEAGKHTVKKLFQKDVHYIIPTFQRPYVWDQEKQWEPLWEDMRNLAEIPTTCAFGKSEREAFVNLMMLLHGEKGK